MSIIILLYLAHYPKDVSRNKLEETNNKNHSSTFKDLLNIENHVIECHVLDSLRKLVTTSSLKPCKGITNVAVFYVEAKNLKMKERT